MGTEGCLVCTGTGEGGVSLMPGNTVPCCTILLLGKVGFASIGEKLVVIAVMVVEVA